MLRVSVFNGELLVYIFTYLLTYLHCVQKKKHPLTFSSTSHV